GVWKLDDAAAAAAVMAPVFDGLADGVVVVAEEFVDFARELSALAVRSPSGQAVAYPVSESVQRDGVCWTTTTPAPELPEDRALVVNELATRPHNTVHWSIDGAHASQFENHLRAVLDLPLGDPATRERWTVMHNVLGGSVADLPSALLHCFARDRRLRAELYGKQVRPGRKVGHVVTFGDDLERVRRRAAHAAGYLMGDPDA